MSNETTKYVKVAVFNDLVQAEIMRGMLEAQGIRVHVSKEAVGQVWGLTVGAASEVELYVPGDQEAAARAVVKEFFSDAEPEN